MSREPQEKASKGSQKWIQVLVNERCEVINQKLAESHGLKQVCWLSPRKEDDYSEYRDRCFIDRLNVNLDVPLKSFWPAKGGPRWDALAKSKTGQDEIIIVEAKSHIGEMVSGGSKAKAERSKKMIRASLGKTKCYLGSHSDVDWAMTDYYQYANRLAHLYFFRKLNELPAYLLYIYFMNDTEMGGPRTQSEWKRAIDYMGLCLGIPK